MVDFFLVNIATGTAIVDALEYAARWDLIPHFSWLRVAGAALIGMSIVSLLRMRRQDGRS